jgi:hypothetical protein
MSHNFVKQGDGTMACSQCGETKADLNSHLVDGHLAPCLDAPGNELSHPVYDIIYTPFVFNYTAPI